MFPEPMKTKIKDGKILVSVKLTDEAILSRDMSLDEAKAAAAEMQAKIKELENASKR